MLACAGHCASAQRICDRHAGAWHEEVLRNKLQPSKQADEAQNEPIVYRQCPKRANNQCPARCSCATARMLMRLPSLKPPCETSARQPWLATTVDVTLSLTATVTGTSEYRLGSRGGTGPAVIASQQQLFQHVLATVLLSNPVINLHSKLAIVPSHVHQ
jgi:hypothetical protein